LKFLLRKIVGEKSNGFVTSGVIKPEKSTMEAMDLGTTVSIRYLGGLSHGATVAYLGPLELLTESDTLLVPPFV
jgi:hypothetical protein